MFAFIYAYLEIGLALAALVSHLLLSRIGPAHLALHELFGFSTAIFAAVRFLLAFLLVMGPTILMGATLPVLARFLVNRRSRVGINLRAVVRDAQVNSPEHARIFSQYSHIASTRTDPAERARLFKKANSLYDRNTVKRAAPAKTE